MQLCSRECGLGVKNAMLLRRAMTIHRLATVATGKNSQTRRGERRRMPFAAGSHHAIHLSEAALVLHPVTRIVTVIVIVCLFSEPFS